MIGLLIAAVEAAEEEPSKTAYYVAGGALVLWAVGISVFGMLRPDFPTTQTQQRAVVGVSIALVVAVMVSVLMTS